MKKFLTILLVALTVISSSSIAAKGDQRELISSAVHNDQPAVINGGGLANSSVVLSFDLGGVASWDGIDDASNVIENCVTGTAITGIGWTSVGITTVGASWLSEPTMLFSNSSGSGDVNGINLTLGVGDDMAGSAVYDSGGIVNFADVPLADIVSNPDGLFPIQFFEAFDDVADAVDADFTGGSMTIEGVDLVASPGAGCSMISQGPPPVVPVNNKLALLLLVLSMMGFVAFRRFA